MDGVAQQVIAPVAASWFTLLTHDVREQPDLETALRELATEEAQALFDLSTGPLIRGRLVRVSETEHVLLVTMHHIVSDGWSLGVFLAELSTLYRGIYYKETRIRSRHCQCSTRTMQCGSGSGLQGRCWKRRLRTGRAR